MTTIRREIGHWIRIAWRRRVEATLNYDNLTGLSDGDVTLTQRVTSKTQEPYIYFRSDGSDEVDATKDDTPRDYDTIIEVVTKVVGNTGGPIQNDEITDEIIKNIRTSSDHYPDLVETFGVNVYVVTAEPIAKFTFEERGATYWKSVITVITRASDVSGDELIIPPDNFGDIVVNRPITGTSDLPAAPTVDGRYDLVRNGDTLSWLVIPNDQGSVVSVTITDGEATSITIDGVTTALGGGDEVSINTDGTVITINGEATTLAGMSGGDPTVLLSELSVGSIVEYGDQLNPNDADLSGFTSHSFTSVNTDPSVQTTEISFADEDGTLMLPGAPWENVREISTGLQSTLPIFSSTRDVGRELLVLTEDNYAIFLVSNATGVNADVTLVTNKAVGVIPSGPVTVYSVDTTREFSQNYIDFGLVDTDQVVNGFNSISFPASSDDDVDATADDRQLRIVAGQGVDVGNSSTSEFNAITISIADDSFKNFDIFNQGETSRTVRVEAEQAEDTINFRAGTGITITGEEIGVGDNITWNVDIPNEANTYIRTNNTADGFQGSNLTDDTTSTARESQSGGNLFSSESNIPDTPGGDYERVLLEDGRYSVVAHLGAEGNWNEQFTIWEDHFFGNATTTPPVVANTLVSLILENTSNNATFDLVAGNTSTTDDNFLIPTFDSDNNRTQLDITYYGGDTESQAFLDFITDLDTTDVRVTAQIQFDGEYTISESNLELGGNLVVNEVDGGTAVFTDEIRLRTTGDFFAQGDAQTTDIGLSGGNFFSNYDQAITFGGGVTNNAPVGSSQFVSFRYTGGEITGDDDDRLLELGDRISYAGVDGVFTITELRGDFRNSYTYVIEPNLSQTIPGDTVVRQVLAQEFVSSVPTTPFFVNRNMLSYSGGAVLLPQITFPDGTTQTSASTGSGGGSELEASTRTFTGLTNTENADGSLPAIALGISVDDELVVDELQREGVTLIVTTDGVPAEFTGTVSRLTSSLIRFDGDPDNIEVPDTGTVTFSLRFPLISTDEEDVYINGNLIIGGQILDNDGDLLGPESYTSIIIGTSPQDLTTETLPTGFDGGNVYNVTRGRLRGTYYRLYASNGASEQLRIDTIDGDVIYTKTY